jgi:hypothetical protein
MTWLLQLYPPRWRRRYGAELRAVIAAQPFSLGASFDLIAGAADAWLHPQLIAPAAPDTKGDVTMIARLIQLKCAGYGPHVTSSDKAKSAAMNVGGTLVLASLWLWSSWRYRDSAYILALSPMTWLIPYLLSLRHTSMKGRTTRAQVIVITAVTVAMTAFFLVVAWISDKI